MVFNKGHKQEITLQCFFSQKRLLCDLMPSSSNCPAVEQKAIEKFNYTRSRGIDRPQTQDIINAVLTDFVELSGKL